MDDATLTRMRKKITNRIEEIERENMTTPEARAVVVLDQQSVGRLSRMDALQQQAMAQATFRRRQQEKTRLKAALARIEEGEYGHCLDCGEDIAENRLELDPATPKCFSCATG